MFWTPRHAYLLVLLSPLLGFSALAADSLAPSSPFLPPGITGAGAVAENTPLELRGIMVDEGGYRFSIFDPVRHSGTWARLNESGHDFVVRAHDVARDTVTLEYQGRVLNLPLHAAKVLTLAAGTPPPGASVGSPPVVLNPTPADELARFNRVRDEIARRRALRDQNAAKGPPQQR